jgi:hypothetical protein
VFFLFHFAYGLGFWSGLTHFVIRGKGAKEADNAAKLSR